MTTIRTSWLLFLARNRQRRCQLDMEVGDAVQFLERCTLRQVHTEAIFAEDTEWQGWAKVMGGRPFQKGLV